MLQLQFVGAFLVALAIIYLPGYPTLRALGMPKSWAICSAPAVSVATIAILSLVYCATGIPCNALTVAIAPCLIAAGVMFARRNSSTEMKLRPITWKRITLYASVGIFAGAILFLSAIPSVDAFAQAWDNVHHINVIRAFADASAFDSLHESAYLANEDISPIPWYGFYPATWHSICAMVLQTTGLHAGLIENAVNLSFCSVVFPLSTLALITLIFNGNRRSILVGSVAALSFPLFPWEMLSYGPLFPNLASFACMPLAQWMFAYLIDRKNSASDRTKSAATLLLICVGIVFLQPNAIFTMAVLLAPLCAQKLWTSQEAKSKLHIPGWALSLAFCALCFGIWWYAFNAPFMASVVHSGVWHWQFATFADAILNVLTLAYVNGFYPSSAQMLSAALILCGIIHSLNDRRYLWMSISYLLTCVIVIASMSGDEFTKALFSGFWYSDPFRCGSMASIAAIPVLVLGATWVISLLAKLAKRINAKEADKVRHALEAVFATIFIVVTFLPIPTLSNGLSSASNVFAKWYSFDNGPYDESEMEFVDKALEIVGSEDVVVNMPYDGSVVAYGESGLNTYYRYFSGYAMEGETVDSCMIRDYLKDASTNRNVQEALRNLDAKYVLILHRYNMPESFIGDLYWKDGWQGVNGLNDETPGFEVVLSEDDMRLYRITCI